MAILSSMQIPDSTVAQLDAVARRMTAQAHGAKVSRVEVIRRLLEIAAPRAEDLLASKAPSAAQQSGRGDFIELARARRRRAGPKHHSWTRADAYDDETDEG